MKKICQRVVLVFLATLVVCGLAMAQSDLGSISGYIKDPSGAMVPNAKVTITNKTGVERQATTNESGYYAITNVPPGFYTMTAEAAGFEKYRSTENKLDPTSQLAIDATLTVGAATQTVEVTASAAALQTESASVQKLVERSQIDALEINGRNPIFMANLVPGTRGGTLASLGFNFTQGPSNFNGSRNPENLITYDGAPATRTRSNGTSLGAADVDSTQEIQILTSNYAAEYGRSSGGQIRIISKSGGDTFHGEAYEYVRNTSLNANTWTRNATGVTTGPTATNFTAPDHYNQFGYNIGGPFYIPNHFNTNKDKVFWYWGEEWVRRVFTDTNSTTTVPTLKMRTGDFSELLVPGNIFYGKSTAHPDGIVRIADPALIAKGATCSQSASATGAAIAGCYPGNIIPAPGSAGAALNTPISENGLGILNAWPVPNLTTPIGTQNWLVFASHPQNQRKDTVSVDVNLSENQRIRVRAVNYAYWEYQPLDGGTNETPKYFDRPNMTSSVDYVWTISPTKVNELLITFSQDVVHIPVNATGFLDRTKGASQCAGCFGTNYNYVIDPSSKLIPTRIPSVNMTNFSGLSGGPYPSHSGGPIFDLSDSFTWIKGNHTIKFGGLIEYQGENDNDEINVSACSTCTNNQNGQFQFNDSRAGGTGVAVANAALGLFDTYSELGHRAYTIFRAPMYEFFVQDGWKATQKLHLDYGLRDTIIVPYHALWGNMAVFDPTFYDPTKAVTVDPKTGLITGSPTLAQLYNGMDFPGTGFPSGTTGHFPEGSGTYNFLFRPSVPNYYSNIQYSEFQPRVGVAYQLNDKTVLRAGVGRYTTRLGVSDSIFLGGNPPFQPNVSLSNGTVDGLGPATGGAAIPLTVTTQSKAFKPPEAWQFNGTFERQMAFKSMLSVGYVGARGLHLQREADINQPSTAVVAANPGVNLNALRPYLGFGSIRQTDNVANSWYHSLQVAWNRRFADGLAFGVAYTLSYSYDDGSNQRDVVPDTYNAHFLWGPSEFDTRHTLVINYVYKLPFYKNQSNLTGRVFGGWEVSGITQFQTGNPCSAAVGTDYAGVGQDANFGCGVNGQYWVENGTPQIVGKFGSGPNAGQWFSTANSDGSPIFTAPPKGTFNTQRVRDILYQPGFENWNLGLFKTIPVNERFRFEFRAEAFNAFNHPNWGGASGGGVQFNPTSSTFGKVTTKGGGPGSGGERNIQLSLKLEF